MQLPVMLKRFPILHLFGLRHETHVLALSWTGTDWTMMRHPFATAEHIQLRKVSTRSKLLSVHVNLHKVLDDMKLIKGGQHLLYTAHVCHV